jgi:GLPGLI family protein
MTSKLLWALMLLALAEVGFAQKHTALEPELLECRYLDLRMEDTLSRHMTADTMILQVGRQATAFFSKDRVTADSVLSTPNGSIKWINLGVQYNKKGRLQDWLSNDVQYYYWNYPEPGLMTVRSDFDGGVEYAEALSLPWEFRDSVKTVLGYECHLAEAEFRGRRWRAWYTLEIPVSVGPWKLQGLPGLVCEAYDDKGHYGYQLVSVAPADGQDVLLHAWKKEYKHRTREEIVQASIRQDELMQEEVRQKGMSGMLGGINHMARPKELDLKR